MGERKSVELEAEASRVAMDSSLNASHSIHPLLLPAYDAID